MYRVVFIDELKVEIDDFIDYMEQNSLKSELEIIPEFPAEDQAEMIDIIFKHNPDAVVTDFMLNEMKTDIKYTVPYNGVQLVTAIQQIRDSFPCFVMTSYDDQAISQSPDVNLVYVKGLLYDSENLNARSSFSDRVKSQIMHYQAAIQKDEKELERLLDLKDKGTATAKDEERIIELDAILESRIDKRSSIPDDFKILSNESKLTEMLNKVDEMLKSIKKDA